MEEKEKITDEEIDELLVEMLSKLSIEELEELFK